MFCLFSQIRVYSVQRSDFNDSRDDIIAVNSSRFGIAAERSDDVREFEGI